MKMSKKLFAAIGMLMLSAVMLVTSSFAWFSINTEVSVNGMQVTAIGDQVFLQITAKDAGFDPSKSNTTYTYAATDGDAVLNTATYSPVDVGYALDGGKTNLSDFKGTVQDGDDNLKLCWVTATGNDSTSHAKNGTYTEVTPQNISKYCYITEYDLRLDPRAGSVAGGTLKVSSVALADTYAEPLAKAISVLIVCEEEKLAILYKQDNGSFVSEAGSATALTAAGFPASTLEEDNIKTVKVYVFFDGNNENCKTINVVDKGFAVNVTFSVE